MKISIKYGSHLPVLTKLVNITTGPILELGIGLYSTPYLHWICKSTKRQLTSYESEPGWIKYFRDCRDEFHSLNLIADWDTLDVNDFWDIAFVDHAPDSRRKTEARKLINNAKFIVLHDSNPENDTLYRYS